MIKYSIAFTLFIFLGSITEGVAQQKKVIVRSKSIPSTFKKTPTKSLSSTPAVSKMASIQFLKEKIDFGTIKEDAIYETSFEFTNIGTADLVIIDADASCGCTLPTIPKEPIKPGEKAKIDVKYTAANKVGPQKPIITIFTNGKPSSIKLQLEGWVEQIPSK